MPRIDLTRWSSHNLHRLSSGSVAVRPGFRELVNPSGDSYVAGFSVRSDITDEVWYYLVEDDGTGVLSVSVKDEVLGDVASVDWGVGNGVGICLSRAQGQIMLTAPGMPTLWGWVGGELLIAEAPAEFLGVYTPMQIPRGVSVGWADRFVISDGVAVYISEPPIRDSGSDSPGRTFLGDNALNPPGGAIKGLCVSVNGDLVAVTTEGVWGLNREAAANGQFVLGVWSKIVDYSAASFDSSAAVRGRVWGLTSGGVRLIDTAKALDTGLNDPEVPMATMDPVVLNDYRLEARLLGGERGVYVAAVGMNYVCVLDDALGNSSWWDTPGEVVGICSDEFGRDTFVCANAMYSLVGNRDEDEGTVTGVYLGRVHTDPSDSTTVRRIDFATDTPDNVVCSVRGTTKSEAAPQVEPVLGTDDWGTGVYGGPTAVRSRRFRWAITTDDVCIEVGAERCLSRVDSVINLEAIERGNKRPTD